MLTLKSSLKSSLLLIFNQFDYQLLNEVYYELFITGWLTEFDRITEWKIEKGKSNRTVVNLME